MYIFWSQEVLKVFLCLPCKSDVCSRLGVAIYDMFDWHLFPSLFEFFAVETAPSKHMASLVSFDHRTQ